MAEENYHRSRTSAQLNKIRSYQSVSDIFTNGESFEKLLQDEQKLKKRNSKRKTLSIIKPKMISLKRYSKTITERAIRDLGEIEEKLNASDIISELSEEDLSMFNMDNSMYSLSQDMSISVDNAKLDSVLTWIKKKILSQNKLQGLKLAIENNSVLNKLLEFEGSRFNIDTEFKKRKENLILFKDNLIKNEFENKKLKALFNKYLNNASVKIREKEKFNMYDTFKRVENLNNSIVNII